MKIDFECHVVTKEFMNQLKASNVKLVKSDVPGLTYFRDKTLGLTVGMCKERTEELKTRTNIMSKYGIDVQALSVAYQMFSIFSATDARKLSRAANDGIANLIAKSPDKFIGFANLPIKNLDDSVDELERAVNDLGLKGVILYTSYGDILADPKKCKSLYSKIVKYNVPILLHPDFALPSKFEKGKDFEIWPQLMMQKNHDLGIVFGWPFATSLALAKIVYNGILKKYPELKIIAAHLGGMIPYYRGRIDMLYGQYHPELGENPSRYFNKVYFDTAIYDQNSIMCGYHLVGPNNLVFATDYPYGPNEGETSIVNAIRSVEGMDIEASEKERIFSGNAAEFFGTA